MKWLLNPTLFDYILLRAIFVVKILADIILTILYLFYLAFNTPGPYALSFLGFVLLFVLLLRFDIIVYKMLTKSQKSR